MQDTIDFNKYKSFHLPFKRDDSDLGKRVGHKIGIAKTQLVLDFPFFGYIITKFGMFPTKDVRSILTDFRTLYYNPETVFDLSVDDIQQVITHLILHLILKHPERRKDKNKQIYSISAEISVDLMMDDIKRTAEKHNWNTRDIRSIYEFLGMPTEKIYQILYNEGVELEEGKGTPKDNSDDFSEDTLQQIMDKYETGKGCSFDEAADLMEEYMSKEMRELMSEGFTGLMRSSFNSVKDRGTMPGSLRTYLNELLEPELPWTHILQSFIQNTLMVDWKWNPPNRRFIEKGLHLPSPEKEYLNVYVAVDTSGSISQEEMDVFISEVFGIMNTLSRMRLVLISCDAEIQSVIVYEDGESVEGYPKPWEGLTMIGGGGTAFEPVFEYIASKGEDPDVLIYFTDGYGSYPDKSLVTYPLIWVMTTKTHPSVPIGEVVYFNHKFI